MTPTKTNTVTKSQLVNADITALLRARSTLFWVVTREEVRVERALVEAAAAADYETQLWDCATGLSNGKNEAMDRNMNDPSAILDRIRDNTERRVYVLRDMHKWLDAVILRKLRSLARSLQSSDREEARSIIVLTPSAEVPPELAGHATVIDYPLPERPEVSTILDDVIGALPEGIAKVAAPTNGMRDAAIDAAVGLTAEEVASCYAKSLVTSKKIDPTVVATEKKRVIARERVLTWHDPDPRGLEAVGGLELLKGWLIQRKAALSQKARAFGLPTPKGVLLVGVPGCGKSLTAKAVASAWGLPLLRLDMGALKSKFVGESEGNIRKALATAEAVAPCVLWLDEIEKALAGSTGPQGDGGVSSDALGAVLSWMQERAGAVFVVATANNVEALPPELLRKGRFDEMFFVDLPTQAERAEILKATLRQHGREKADVDIVKLSGEPTRGFTGAELAAMVPDALFVAFADGEREITTADLVTAAEGIVPLGKTAEGKIEALRALVKGRARLASRPEAVAGSRGRALDIK